MRRLLGENLKIRHLQIFALVASFAVVMSYQACGPIGTPISESDINSLGTDSTAPTDTVAPIVTLLTFPPALTPETSASFSFTATDASSSVANIECSLNGAAFSTCSSPMTYTNLSSENHFFRVRASDIAGNVSSPVSYIWRVSASGPSLSITSVPTNPTSSNSASFSFSATPAQGTTITAYNCSLDGAAYAACTSPRAYSGLSSGTHTFRVTVTDTLGNTSQAAQHQWVVDTVAPTVAFTAQPASLINVNTASFSFTTSDSGVGVQAIECSLDNAAFAACTSPRSLVGLPQGARNFRVRARDRAGNVSSIASHNFTVDSVRPTVTLTSTPPATSTSTSASMAFTATDASPSSGITSVQCQLDSNAYQNCPGTVSYTNLTVATHTVRVRVRDAAANETIASYSFTVEAAPGDSGGSARPQAFDTGVIYSAQRFVSANGRDTNSGTRISPFLTLQRALQGAAPGTEVVLLAGTYPALGSVSGLAGNSGAPIKIRGEGQVVVNATSGPTGLSLSDPRYVVIENITVQNSPIHGINIDDGGSYSSPGDHLVLRNVTIRNIGGGGNNDCLKMSGINNFHIEGSRFENCNRGEAIDMVGCHNGIVTNSLFTNIPQHAAQAKGGSDNVLFHGNIFQNIAGHAVNLGGSTDPALMRPLNPGYEGRRIRATANIIINALAPAAFIACTSCEFTQNTVINPSRWMIRILEGGSDGQLFPSRDGFVYNNIFVFQSSQVAAFVNIGVGTLPDTFSFSNNLWYSTDNPGFSGPSLGAAGPEQNSIIQRNPAFVNSTAGDYRLQNHSPAIGAGRTLPTPAPSDKDGYPYRSPPSLGAHELRL